MDEGPPLRLFISYWTKLLNNFENHLKILERHGLIAAWNDRQIEAGQDLEAAN